MSKLKQLSMNGSLEPIEEEERVRHCYGRMKQIIDNLYEEVN